MPEIFTSKKFWIAAAAVILAMVGMVSGYSPEQIATVTAPLMIYVGAQGLADFGKGAK